MHSGKLSSRDKVITFQDRSIFSIGYLMQIVSFLIRFSMLFVFALNASLLFEKFYVFKNKDQVFVLESFYLL